MVTASIEQGTEESGGEQLGIPETVAGVRRCDEQPADGDLQTSSPRLVGERLKLDVLNMYYEVGAVIVNTYHDDEDFDGFQLELFRQLSTESPVDVEEFRTIKGEELTEKVYEAAMTSYDRHCKVTAGQSRCP